MLKRFLITPGPTPVPPEVLLAGAEPIVHHRAPRFVEIFNECVAGLQYVYQTTNDVVIFAASGTGAMEAAVVNVVNPGDKVIVASVGNFGERWVKLGTKWGAQVVALEFEWGTKADPAAILVVDAISGLGATDLPTDAWKVDVCVAGSQKALMIPPGLAMAAVSDKAWKVVEQCTTPRFYFDWLSSRAKARDGQTPFTPAVSLFVMLNKAIEM